MWGYVASADKAQLELDENQLGVDELVVKRVLAPGDAWIVVHEDDNGAPGMRVGIARVKRGESTDVKVELEKLTTPKVIVAVHADRGTKNKFDFDMMKKEMSPDRPFFVDEKELAKVATVREFGVEQPRQVKPRSRSRTSWVPPTRSWSTRRLPPPRRGSSCTSRRMADRVSESALRISQQGAAAT